MFKPTGQKIEKDGKEHNLGLVCTMGDYWFHWDSILAMYLFLAPQVFSSPKVIASSILSGIWTAGISPSSILRFSEKSCWFLNDLVHADLPLQSLTRLASVAVQMEMINRCHNIENHPEFDEATMLKQVQDQIQKEIDAFETIHFSKDEDDNNDV